MHTISLNFAVNFERMWAKIASFIIRNRLFLLLLLVIGTGFMGYHASQVKMAYDLPRVIPTTDEAYKEYQDFKETYQSDGNFVVIGVQNPNLFSLDFFNEWYDLHNRLKELEGVVEVTSLISTRNLKKQPDEKAFEINQLFANKPQSQNKLDSQKRNLHKLPFYEELYYNQTTRATFMALELEKDLLNSANRENKINEIRDTAESFSEETGVKVRYSGIPYIRSIRSGKIKQELTLFSVFAVLMTSLFLVIFFRSVYAVVFPLVVIAIVIISVLGTIDLVGYRITILTGLIPPLIVIIGIPNFIYFLNKYHNEYHKHGNKMRAVTRMVQKIGIVIFLTNFTTAIGFGVLFFTNSPILREFGLVASINVAVTFIVSIISIPAVFSILPAPSSRQTKYLQNPWMQKIIGFFITLITQHRYKVYLTAISLTIAAIIGLSQLRAVGYILDDIPQDDQLQQDLNFFERHFKGIMPFEVLVNTGQENGLRKLDNLEKIGEFQDSLNQFDEFARSISMVNFIKFTNQAFHSGNPKAYELPSSRDRTFLMPYIRSMRDTGALNRRLVDSNNQVARISTRIEDIGSVKLRESLNELKAIADSVFTGKATSVTFTGTSLLFLKKNSYLIESLVYSLLLAFSLVSIIMGILFRKFRMVWISLLPNFVPLLITAGLMGLLGLALKPSTVLVFSIAFGISVDDALHYLVKYRQELENHDWDIARTVEVTMHETGVSMIYTSVVLFFGFAIFYPSSFGGTSSLGMLTSITLMVALCTNLILLPSLILSFDKKKRLPRNISD